MMTKFGSVFIQLASVDSTNNYVANLIQQGSCQDGSVIMADYQTNGRGQRGNSWQSVSGQNLMFSLAFHPPYPLEEHIRLSWYTALIWQQCLLRFGVSLQIKWPNDLYVNNRKIGGVLIEQQLKGDRLEWGVLGCGINVNAKPELTHSTSLFEEVKQHFKPYTVLQEFLDLFNGQQALLLGDFNTLKQKFEDELWLRGMLWRYQTLDGRQFDGCILGVNNKGELGIQTDDSIQYFGNQEIKFLHP